MAKSSIDKYIIESNTIDFLRFPLIVLVVMIHAHKTEVTISGVKYIYDLTNFPIYSNMSYLISDIIASLAVPMFYVISGYLFFNKLQNFSWNEYDKKMKSRFKSLLIPYLFWNIAILCAFAIFQMFVPGVMSGANRLIIKYSFFEYLNSLWGGYADNQPICYQLWFMRDLMVVVLLAPMISFLIKKTSYIYLILLGMLWLMGIEIPITGVSILAILFFSIGAFVKLNSKTLVEDSEKLFNFMLFAYVIIVTIILIMYNFNTPYISYIKNISIIFGLPVFFSFVVRGILNNKLEINKLLLSGNFFVYAFHAFPLALIIKLFVKYIHPTTEASVITMYITTPIVTIFFSLIFFALLMRILPKFTTYITGSRA